MFYNCQSLISLDVSNWDTSNVTSMRSMFRNCTSLTSLNVSNWNTSNVTDMYGMFWYCHDLTSLDVSNWNTSNVTYMYDMFYYCSSLTTVTGIIDMSKVSNYYGMLYNTSKLQSINIKLPGTGLNKTDEVEFKNTSNVSDTTNVNFIYDNWNLNINYDADAEESRQKKNN